MLGGSLIIFISKKSDKTFFSNTLCQSCNVSPVYADILRKTELQSKSENYCGITANRLFFFHAGY